MDSSIFFGWFEKFCTVVRKRLLLLIFGGHVSHLLGKLIIEAVKNQVILLTLLANARNVLHPLGAAYFGSIKRKWQVVLNKMCSLQGSNKGLSKVTFANELCSVWTQCLNPRSITSGFRTTGIYPLNRESYPTARFNPRQKNI